MWHSPMEIHSGRRNYEIHSDDFIRCGNLYWLCCPQAFNMQLQIQEELWNSSDVLTAITSHETTLRDMFAENGNGVIT